MISRKERLLRTLKGEHVDRQPISFIEIEGITQNSDDPDPFNVYSDPSWHPLLEMAVKETDRIVSVLPAFSGNGWEELGCYKKVTENTADRIDIHEELLIGNQKLTSHFYRNTDIDTLWCMEHFIKDEDDIRAYLELPREEVGEFDTNMVLQIEEQLGDTGIVSIDIGDTLCDAAILMPMEVYLIIAMTEQELFVKLLNRIHEVKLQRIEKIAKALPGRLFRVCGPEFATAPYLPPQLFKKYVQEYDQDIIDILHKNSCYVRIHCHGRVRQVLDMIAEMNWDGIDPLEPPGQGDVELAYVREKYGENMVLFGNIEAAEIATMKPEAFKERVKKAVEDGNRGSGRGFVFCPSAPPLGREISEQVLTNYRLMLEAAYDK